MIDLGFRTLNARLSEQHVSKRNSCGDRCYVYILVHFKIAHMDEAFKAASEMRFSTENDN